MPVHGSVFIGRQLYKSLGLSRTQTNRFGVSLYGLGSPKTVIIIPAGSSKATLLQYKSTQFDFPFLEYRHFCTFSMDQSSSMIVQFTAGFDIPYGGTVVSPQGEPVPELQTVWQLGMRIIFDWRHYY